MIFTKQSISHTLTFEEVIGRLRESSKVDGLLTFGSRSTKLVSAISDYDLLVLVNEIPIGIFQMITHIDNKMADLVLYRTDDIQAQLDEPKPVSATSQHGYFLQKVKAGKILYDSTGTLMNAKSYLENCTSRAEWLLPVTGQAEYASWFWPNVNLYHLRRMANSDDPIYETAVDMSLMGGIGNICRDYFQIRNLLWQGGKAAIRTLEQHDPGFLGLFRECIAEHNRERKLILYTQLVEHAIAPIGPLFAPGMTAVCLEDRSLHPVKVKEALLFWEECLS